MTNAMGEFCGSGDSVEIAPIILPLFKKNKHFETNEFRGNKKKKCGPLPPAALFSVLSITLVYDDVKGVRLLPIRKRKRKSALELR